MMQIAILIPCHNEEAAIGNVVRDFAAAVPEATIYVYDNNSSDRTREIATKAGAQVRSERRQGKGHVVCRMFADIDADVYVLVDGDDTYDAASAPRMIERLRSEQLDMVTGVRIPGSRGAYRPGHVFGNRLLPRAVPRPVAEMEPPYKDRPAGSASKLRTYRDGFRILRTIFRLVLEVRPLALLGWLSFLFALTSVGIAVPVFETYAQTGLVPRLPTAVLSARLMVLAFLSLASGLILEMVTLGRRGSKRPRYLALPAPPPPAPPAP